MMGQSQIVIDGQRGRRGFAARPTGRLVLGLVATLVVIGIVAALNWTMIRPMLTSDTMLLSIGVFLLVVTGIAWVMSNRAEATPNEDQLLEMRHFVNDHFAKYVARGLLAEGVGPVAISEDPAWRKVYLQHLRLHNELYSFRRDIAVRLYTADIDAAVRRELEALQAAGQRPNPVVAS
jgi:hypothetical protein